MHDVKNRTLLSTMRSTRPASHILAVSCMKLLLCAALANCQAQDNGSSFRIETDVMLTGQAQPIQQSVTLFHNAVAYDFSRDNPHSVIVIEAAHNRIALMDSQRQVQTRVNLQELKQFIDQAQQRIPESSLAPAIADSQQVSVNGSIVTVGRQFVCYQATLQSSTSSAADLYADFADASALLNAWRAPDRNPPPFARLQLNQLIREHRGVPIELTRTTKFSSKPHEELKSRLHINWRLSTEDGKQIEAFRQMLEQYPTLELAQFTNSNLPTKR
ncbi:MAG: hypothetical protein KF752_00300 [Pirellulaceae bacterium]|nr:hypothetical protein [Pirellulaceae bacterium]